MPSSNHALYSRRAPCFQRGNMMRSLVDQIPEEIVRRDKLWRSSQPILSLFYPQPQTFLNTTSQHHLQDPVSYRPQPPTFSSTNNSSTYLTRQETSANVGQLDLSYQFPSTIFRHPFSSDHSAVRDHENRGMTATMHDNLSQEMVCVTTTTTTTSAPHQSGSLAPVGNLWIQESVDEPWHQTTISTSSTENPLQQSMESGSLMPDTYEEFCSPNSSETSSVTLTEDDHSQNLPQFTFTWESETPSLHSESPLPTTWVFRQPDLQGRFQRSQVGPVTEALWTNMATEQVLVENVLDSRGLALYEVISIPSYLLDQGRSINCHGDLMGTWQISGLMKFRDGYAYTSCNNHERQEIALIHIPQIFFRTDKMDWPFPYGQIPTISN
ncbi:hypothetical protein DFH09DRAFT_1067428 [Mycena vulgaris]|nr:hypothetical protein DFH09DRAFT_1067428 [Mycena vulgaris]